MFNISPELGKVPVVAVSQLKPMAPILSVLLAEGVIGKFSSTFLYHSALRLKVDGILSLAVICKFSAETSPPVSASYLFPYWSYAVSYTHLDVYKRQVITESLTGKRLASQLGVPSVLRLALPLVLPSKSLAESKWDLLTE